MNKALIHIFDSSACLNRRQMKDYVSGAMTNEEVHAAEVHLNSCMFCSEAIDGLYEQREQGAVGAMVALDNEFLKEKLSLSHPEVHLNSLAPAQSASYAAPRRRGRYKTKPLKHTSAIAAMLLLGFGLWWYMGRDKGYSHTLPEQSVASTTNDNIGTPYGGENTPKPEKSTILALASDPAEAGKEIKAVAANTAPAGNKTGSLQPATPVNAVPATEPKEKKAEEKKLAIAAAAKLTDGPSPSSTASPKTFDVLTGATGSNNEGARKSDLRTSFTDNRETSKEIAPAATEQGDSYYSQGKYSAALSAYKKDMSHPDKMKRLEATVMAARCYLSLGNKADAQQLLQQLVEEGGPQKRAAKKLLKEMNE
jgi:TolA-binding protein